MFRPRIGFGLAVLAALLLTACEAQTYDVPVTQIVVQTQEIVRTVEIHYPTPTPVPPTPPYSSPHPLLGVVGVRQGIAHCTNRADLIQVVYPYLTDTTPLWMDSFLPTAHWAYHTPTKTYPYDPQTGGQLFAAAGWELALGQTYRTNAAGDEMALKLTLSNAPFAQAWGAAFEKNMAQCGLRVVRFHAPSEWWLGERTGLARRDFEAGAFAWVARASASATFGAAYSAYACDQIPSPLNDWRGQNYMGWCNPSADAALRQLSTTSTRADQLPLYATLQNELANDLPSLPLFSRAEIFAVSKEISGVAPGPNERFYTWNVHDWVIPNKDTIVIGLTREPTTLFLPPADDFAGQLVNRLIYGQGYTTLNYDAQPLLYPALPSASNTSTDSEVVVKTGSRVVDARGQVIQLAPGAEVINSAGKTITYDEKLPLVMRQVVLTSQYLPGVKFADGTALTQGDIALTDKIACSPLGGQAPSLPCELLAKAEYSEDGKTVIYTLLPGATTAESANFLANRLNAGGPYPSELVVPGGRLLADVPPEEWSSLTALTETPLGIGPYQLVNWERGKQMVFLSNEHYVLGQPKTRRLIITFVADATQAVARLLAGEINVIGPETLGTGPEAQVAVEAAKQGKLNVIVLPTATWEHIDLALFVK